MSAKISMTGPLDPRNFIDTTGQFNLVKACMAAQALDIKIVFCAEWDGSLSLGCANGVMYSNFISHLPPVPPPLNGMEEPLLRTKGGWSYKSYYGHAEERRCAEIFRDIAKNGGGELPLEWPPKNVEPHAGLNAACMWYYARVEKGPRECIRPGDTP